MDGYTLSRQFFDWCFENPEKVKPNHVALYFWIVETCNRMGWKEKFGLPTSTSMEAIGIKSYNTYIQALHELVEWGFVLMVERSRNQYSANIVALSKFDKAYGKALDKALTTHRVKQHESIGKSISESISESIDSIIKQSNKKPINKKLINIPFETFWDLYDKRNGKIQSEKLWNRLTDEQRTLILNDIPKYKAQLTDLKYQLNPANYLKDERFKDDRKPRKINGAKVLDQKLFNGTW